MDTSTTSPSGNGTSQRSTGLGGYERTYDEILSHGVSMDNACRLLVKVAKEEGGSGGLGLLVSIGGSEEWEIIVRQVEPIYDGRSHSSLSYWPLEVE